MSRREHLVLCGGFVPPEGAGSHVLRLALDGHAAKLRLRVHDIGRCLAPDIPDELILLLEVAGYVYAACSAIPRCDRTDAQLGARWRRKLRLVIPVRRPNLWRSAPVLSALVGMMGILSDNDCAFELRSLAERPAMQSYLELSGEDVEAFAPGYWQGAPILMIWESNEAGDMTGGGRCSGTERTRVFVFCRWLARLPLG